MAALPGWHVFVMTAIFTLVTVFSASTEDCHVLASAPETVCQVTRKFDDADWVCQATSVVVCEESRYLGLGSTCQNIKGGIHIVYMCSTGQWVATALTTRTAKRRPKRGRLWDSFCSKLLSFLGTVSNGQWTCSDSTCTLQCNTDFQSSGTTSISCVDSEQWTAVGTCIVHQCQPFTSTAHGIVNCTHKAVEGSTCSVVCNRGYKLQGQSSVTCLATEQWDRTLPVCNIVVCPYPANPANGQLHCPNGFQFGSVCTLACDDGYTLQGHADIECLENAASTPAGTCSDLDPPQFVNGCPSDIHVYASALGRDTIVRWDTPTVTDTSAKYVTLSSNVTSGASFPPGVTVVRYTANDVSGNFQDCHFTVNVTVLSCNDPKQQLYTPLATMAFTCPDGHVYGAKCAVSCTQNYRLMGVDAVWCDQNNKTFPPQTFWSWAGTEANKPQCKVDRCPPLKAPGNGALSCYHGNLGWDCLMSCDSPWDVPASTDGHFYCTNDKGNWNPSRVLNCVERTGPSHVRLQAEVFYTTDNCSVSLDLLRQRFVSRMNQSVFRDACAGVIYCVPENVQVTCGPTMKRVKRETGGDALTWTHRHRRAIGANTHTIVLSFHLTLPYYDGGDLSVEETHEAFSGKKEEVFKTMESNIDYFSIDKLPADSFTLSHEPFECPAGTLNTRRDGATPFSCAGCGAGHYLPAGSTQCQPCPVGSYTDLDNATACTLCPPGWSTANTGSTEVADCCVRDITAF